MEILENTESKFYLVVYVRLKMPYTEAKTISKIFEYENNRNKTYFLREIEDNRPDSSFYIQKIELIDI